mgnify:CR=1 FL=1|tara:strand:+ start:231 stop:413 length:183 start_codon:yes stop_codon:yes gene_type:complete
MVRESKNKSLLNWIEEIQEEVEVQFYGITGAIIFFIVLYFIFKPNWMKNVFDVFMNLNYA